VALLHPHRADDLEKSSFAGLARQARQLLEGPGDDVAHAVASVQRGVRVLEDDLHRLQLPTVALGAFGSEWRAFELDDRTFVRHAEAEQHPCQSRLAGAGLAY